MKVAKNNSPGVFWFLWREITFYHFQLRNARQSFSDIIAETKTVKLLYLMLMTGWWTLLCRSLLKFTPWSLPPSLLTKSRKLESCQLFCVLYIMFHTSGLRNCCDVSPSGFRPHQICASAAFDTVNHNKDQKTVLGFSGTVRNWFNSCGHFLIGDYTSEHPKNVVEFPKARYSDLFCSTSTCCHLLLQCNRHFFFLFFYIFLPKRNMTVMLQKLSTYNRCIIWTNMKAFHLI